MLSNKSRKLERYRRERIQTQMENTVDLAFEFMDGVPFQVEKRFSYVKLGSCFIDIVGYTAGQEESTVNFP